MRKASNASRARILAVAAALGLTLGPALVLAGATASRKAEITRNLDIFTSLYRELQTSYVDTIDPTATMTTAIAAMLDKVDPYTEYIPEEGQEDFRTVASGQYAGIGSTIMQRDGAVYITGPQEGSPAQRAGLLPGDRIWVLDGDTLRPGATSADVSKRLRGQPGTHVLVTVVRPWLPQGADSVLTVDITRAQIPVATLPYHGLVGPDSDIGYIELATFNEKSAGAVHDAVQELKARGARSLILDLRDNGGGIVEGAVQIAGLFVPKGTEVLRYKGRDAMQQKTFKTTRAPLDTDIPLVVLVDENTASSAEIVSGALQDLDRAVIVGNQSYGKGLVQATRPLPYNGLLKVTIAKYYIPSGRLIQAIDYSRRREDGSVARIPDSLTRAFSTAGGRQVRDGGGITPDVTVTYPRYTRLLYALSQDMWIFDYANRMHARQGDIGPAEDFTVTDSLFRDFKAFVDPARLTYDRPYERTLDALRDIARDEGYMTDSLAGQFDVLGRMLHHDLDRDLDINRPALEQLLGAEIAQRYHGTRGQRLQQLRADPGLDSAITVLTTPGRYASILRPAKKPKEETKKANK